jgi:hypothetical protein
VKIGVRVPKWLIIADVQAWLTKLSQKLIKTGTDVVNRDRCGRTCTSRSLSVYALAGVDLLHAIRIAGEAHFVAR